MTTATERLDRIDPTTRRVPPLGGFSLTFLAVELKRLFRNSSVVVFTLIFPIAMLFMIGLPNKNTPISSTPIAQGGLSAAVPIMISMAVYGAMVASTMTGVSVASERAQGWSRQLRLTPLNPVVYILVKVVCGMVLGGIAVLVTLVVGAVMGITAPMGNLMAAGLLAWLSSLMLTSLGLAVGYAFPAQNAMRYLGPILPILSFMGGLFVPLTLMPDALQTAAKFTPLWGIANLSQSAVIGVAPDGWSVLNLVVWFLVFTGLAVMMFRRDTKRV
ncbi:ABC transporter permease [uncultured Microbacterium sp.]|uniref:ABC transporter permease n=1 Tax=uncultured Microbacterium sp. TaxID=191216 RepID=UPI0025CCACF1|nr:ABC transporter permease [uncultured Microbacterium sp.]